MTVLLSFLFKDLCAVCNFGRAGFVSFHRVLFYRAHCHRRHALLIGGFRVPRNFPQRCMTGNRGDLVGAATGFGKASRQVSSSQIPIRFMAAPMGHRRR
jgi:hypothetical protein